LTVSGFLTLLDERHRGRLDPEADEFIAHALSGTRKMQRLIADLLEYSRAGRTGLVPEPVPLGAVVRETLAGLSASIEQAGAEVVVDPLPVVRADPGQLGRLLQNLLSNAIKFAAEARPVVHVSARDTATGWEVSVTDNGVGIDPADRELIFDMFQRRSRGDAVDGTGIGLAICQRIVQRHGGRIWVEAAAGGGSAFRFTLPDAAHGPFATASPAMDDADEPDAEAAAA
jgi:signal transduction histidine kinase